MGLYFIEDCYQWWFVFIQWFYFVVMIEQQKYGILVLIMLVQGILESDVGVSEFVIIVNNYFGIKCYKCSYQGGKVFWYCKNYVDDDL